MEEGAKKRKMSNLHSGRSRNARPYRYPRAWASGRWVTYQGGSPSASPQRSCPWPWGRVTPPQGWTGCPLASQTCQCTFAISNSNILSQPNRSISIAASVSLPQPWSLVDDR